MTNQPPARFFFSLLLLFAAFVAEAAASSPKYVFLFVGDGMSMPQRMVAETFARKVGHGELAMNRLPYQTMTRTSSANSVITDSAAAATAFACGEKTNNGMLGVRPDGSRLVSVAECAKKKGMKVGIVTTVAIVHATPAGFYAHNTSRGQSYQIGLDLIDSGFDLFAGAGVYDKASGKGNPKSRGDLFDLARNAGYTVCFDRAAWAALRPGSKSWSVFAPNSLPFEIDTPAAEARPIPALEELVRKAITLLENPNGFFLMCEGGKVDFAGHANDAATNLREVLALDRAVRVALAFLDQHPRDTLVITTGDHETGGMAMGFAGIGGKFYVEELAKQKISCEAFSEEMKQLIRDRKGNVSFAEVEPILAEKFGLDNLSDVERKSLADALAKDVSFVRQRLADTTAHDVRRRYVFAQAAKNALNARAGVGWSSSSHTALPTLTTAKGSCAEILLGMSENTEIALRLKDLLK